MDSVHNHGTRRAEAGLFVPRANNTAAKNMFAYEGAVLYDGLPMVLKSADNFIDFKRNCARTVRDYPVVLKYRRGVRPVGQES